MPYWMQSTLAGTPATLWVYLWVGLPWALALLPRADWRDRALVFASAFAFGPALLTTWMLILGTSGGKLLRFDLIFGGMVVLAAVGTGLAWRKWRENPARPVRIPLALDEKLLLGLIAAALILRWLGVAFWTFTAYDALWVYGYEGKLYALLGQIPAHIGYYPQFLPLQYTYAQLAVGTIDDHVARAMLPFLHWGSILAAYVLGSRLFNRRVGFWTAGLWALYPHVGEWSRFGDLEIPLTFLCTLSAVFFLMAWRGDEPRRRYALLAGLTFGVAMWTKPTAGALVWGVLLLLAVELIRRRFDWRAWLPRFEVALIMGLASLPLGGVWYVRNVLLGHNAIDFPTDFWLTQAQRSGVEFGWLILALLVLLAYLYLGRHDSRPDWRRVLVGAALVGAGLVPTILSPRRMDALEWAALAVGAAILAATFWQHAKPRWTVESRETAAMVGWALLLALPYFVTWFYSYSYHYRLSFPIVPLLSLPSAVILGRWFSVERVAAWRPPLRFAYLAVIVAVSIPGVVACLYDANVGWDWLWSGELEDDFDRYASGNAALMNVVAGLQQHHAHHAKPMIVYAPGVRRLPFFFPLDDIRIDDLPTRFDQFTGDGFFYFIYGSPEGVGAYASVPPLTNQVLAALGREDIMRYSWGKDDGTFRYAVYEPKLAARFEPPHVNAPTPEGEVIFGEFARLLGHDIGGAEFWHERRLLMHLYWEVLKSPPDDYTIYVHLRDRDGKVWAAWDNPAARTDDGKFYYSTLVWEPGEYIRDERELELYDAATPLGDGYTIVVGMYKLDTGERVPVTMDGQPAGDGYTLHEKISVVEMPES